MEFQTPGSPKLLLLFDPIELAARGTMNSMKFNNGYNPSSTASSRPSSVPTSNFEFPNSKLTPTNIFEVKAEEEDSAEAEGTTISGSGPNHSRGRKHSRKKGRSSRR